MALALCTLAACQRPEPLALHYEPASVAAQASFFPARIAIVPPTVPGGRSYLNVGGTYDAEGYVKANFLVQNAGRKIAEVIARALEHAGLKPSILAGPPPGNMPPYGVDFLLTSEVTKFQCVKHLVAGKAGLEGHFTMTSDVGLHLTLSTRRGVMYDGSTVYVAREPPESVDAATYKPQVTDPAQSLSIALSRAAETLIAQSGFRTALPQRTITGSQTPVITATPAAAATKAAGSPRKPGVGAR
ncbi:MAG: hypothetical protein ACREQN_05880 [Candidatus Binataceae bacterium]